MAARRPLVIAVIGPTATGKSALGVDLAARFDADVINCDAMQLYRGMDIGTAKISEAERRGVAHHQLDVLDVTETASVAAYQWRTRAIIESLLAEGRGAVLVGGSGLYVQAVLDELEFPGTDPEVRGRWTDELDRLGPSVLHRLLAERDPVAAAGIQTGNGRRIVRALEVMEITGRPFSASMPVRGRPRHDAIMIGVDRETGELDQRVDRRVTAMFADGLVDEVRGLAGRGLRDGLTASRALGYQQVLAALDGDGDLDAAAGLTARATRRFVRRQRSWFRRDTRIQWLDGARADLLEAAVGLCG